MGVLDGLSRSVEQEIARSTEVVQLAVHYLHDDAGCILVSGCGSHGPSNSGIKAEFPYGLGAARDREGIASGKLIACHHREASAASGRAHPVLVENGII